MANSDNTVRGGLTPKYKDTEILYEMLPYQNMEVPRAPFEGMLIAETQHGSTVVEYKSGFKEFRLTKVELKKLSKADGPNEDQVRLTFKSLSMMVVVQGTGRIRVKLDPMVEK